jgi:putative transposase
LDETGLILGLNRTHARSQVGTRVRELKPFYRAAKITVIGAISMNKVLALMTMNDSRMDSHFPYLLTSVYALTYGEEQ